MQKKISTEMKWRESMIKLSRKQGITKAARKYRINRSTIYKWIKRYDGTIESLRSKSTRPYRHPNQHTEEEIRLIKNMWKRNVDCGLVVFWIKLRSRGYERSISGLYHQMRKLGIYNFKKKKRKRKIKEYIQMEYPGQRVQIDIKYVPLECISKERLKLYQYTAIDEYSRLRYLQIYESADTYTAYMFVKEVIKKFPFKIKEIRTDNGLQFTFPINKK